MKRGAKLFKRKKKKKDRKAGDEDDGGDSGSSYGDYTEDDASNADDLDTATATDGESSDTEEPVAWRPQLVDSDSEEGEESSAPNGRERGRSVPTKAASQRAPSPRRRDEEEDEDGKISQPVTDPLGLLGTLSLPPALDKSSHVDPSRDGFDARKYLGDLHTQTSYADLQQGARTLRSLLRGQEMQLKTFVRDNFGRFISCKDSIDGIYEEIKDNDMSHHAIQKLNDTYIDLQLRSDRLFGSLLERRAEIEEKRNVLAALKRYQTIFNLPLTIQRHLDQHEYEKAVREYKKAVGYLAGTNVRIFVKVSEQINSLADRLRDRLLASLRDPALTLAEHDYHIGLLHDLGGDVDPAWHYLSNVQASIVAALTTTDPPADESADAVGGGGATTTAAGGGRLPAIRRLCNVLLTGLPSLTHMAHVRPPAPPRGEEGTRKLVEECLALYAQQVRAAFAAPDTGEATTAGGVAVAGEGRELLDDVRQCILEVAACAKGLAPALAAVDLGPGNLLAPLISELSLLFTSSIRRHTLARAAKLWEDGAEQGGAAYGDADSPDDADADVGKGWGADVYMAKRLAALLRSALHHYQSLPAIEERVLDEIESLALETVKAFADGLHAACWPGDDETRSIALASAPRYGADLGAEERMIVAMANSAYAREEVVILIERLISTLRPATTAAAAAASKPSTSSTTVVDHLSTLENLLAAEYVRCKAAQIYALLGPALADQLATPFSAPPEVREYVIEVVAGVVTAQAELAPVALLVRTHIITSLLERITSCYEESLRSRLPPPTRSRPWDGGCALQLHTDVLFLQAAFAQRLSPTASAALTRLQKSFLPRLTSTQEEARAAVGKGMANAALILRALQ